MGILLERLTRRPPVSILANTGIGRAAMVRRMQIVG